MESINEAVAGIDALVRRVESLPDPGARAVATDLVQAVMGLHQAVLERMLEAAAISGAGAVDRMLADDLVAGVLVLHGLHPQDVETRARRAVERLQRYFDSRGARIELLELTPELVRVRHSGRHRPENTRQMIEDAFGEAAPEIAAVIVEGLEDRDSGFVPLADLVAAQPA